MFEWFVWLGALGGLGSFLCVLGNCLGRFVILMFLLICWVFCYFAFVVGLLVLLCILWICAFRCEFGGWYKT